MPNLPTARGASAAHQNDEVRRDNDEAGVGRGTTAAEALRRAEFLAGRAGMKVGVGA